MKTLIVALIMALASASACAVDLEDGPHMDLKRTDCMELGRYGAAGFAAKKHSQNVSVVMQTMKGPIDTWRNLQMEAANYGYMTAQTSKEAFSYGFGRCWDNWEQLYADQYQTPFEQLKK